MKNLLLFSIVAYVSYHLGIGVANSYYCLRSEYDE